MIAGLAVVSALVLATSPATAPLAPPSAVDPCRDVPNCHEFGRADVTGDGLVDRIGYRLLAFDESAGWRRHTVRIIVTTGDGRRLTADSTQRGFFEGPYGAAPLDGVPGAEIALSWVQGLHASQVQVFTFRDGSLVRERSWYRDSGFFYGSGIEWIPGESAQAPIMRQCTYQAKQVPKVTTSTVDFTWQLDRWIRGVPTLAEYTAIDRMPWQCARFRVPGMSRSPMNVYR